MRVVFSNGQVLTDRDHPHLICLENHLYVVAKCLLCTVESLEEGLELMARLKSGRKLRRIVIKTSRRLG